MLVEIDWGGHTATLEDNFIWLTFPKSQPLPDDLGARWYKSKQKWRIPATYQKLQLLQNFYPEVELDDPLREKVDTQWGFPQCNFKKAHPSWGDLYTYQREAVEYLLCSPHKGSLLNLSPGLGKTVTSIVAADLTNAQRVLVVCPKPLILTWQRESQKWSDWNLRVVHGENPPKDFDKVITNYRQLLNYDYVQPWDLVILDESIKTKNRKTQTFGALKEVTREVDKVWELSGSPISRYLDDLWAQLYLCAPKYFTSYWRFTQRYCIVDQGVWGWNIQGNQPGLDPSSELRDFIFTRHQKDVLSELPEYIQQTYDLELTSKQRKLYDQALKEFLIILDSGEKLTLPNKMSQLTRLIQIVSNPVNITEDLPNESAKLNTLVELLQSNALPLPALIWVYYRRGARKVAEKLDDLGYSVGLAIGGADVDSFVDQFQDDNLDILVLSLAVGSHGLTLTKARSIVYFDRGWNADAYLQSRYRVQRIGLNHHPLMITLRCPGTVEELVEQNLAGKLPGIAEISNADLKRLLGGLR